MQSPQTEAICLASLKNLREIVFVCFNYKVNLMFTKKNVCSANEYLLNLRVANMLLVCFLH